MPMDAAGIHYTERAVALCRDLVACPGVSGDEGATARVLADAMRRMGFDSLHVDRYGNVIGRIHGTGAGPCVLLDGHMDTVPVPDPAVWNRQPFGGEIVDGKLYGRGASDMKGALACMVSAAALFAAETERKFNGSLCVAGTVHEECFEGIACREISAAIRPDYVIIGEASELNLKTGQRGRAEIVLQTFGKPAHSANPDAGANAVIMMIHLLERVEAFAPPTHPVLGQGITVVTDIVSSPYPGSSVVPARCRATCDRRLLVGEIQEDVLRPFQTAIAELSGQFADFHATASIARGEAQCYTGQSIEAERFYPAWLFDENEPFVQAALAWLRAAGLDPAVSHYSFCTNGSHYAGEAGIPTLGFGPSLERLAHTVDEYIEIDQISRGVAGYAAIVGGLLCQR
ncbi:MAG: YgeY family selenium metabolism-linked hydrolase [Desulfovibrio sp.]|nr:YgeY family selenium metabolism-linked hydrolase [Desulfovibrio sp.]